MVARKAEPGTDSHLAPARLESALRSNAQPLDPPVREEMEAHFGVDFSSVRVHADRPAAESSLSIGALAYTVGSDVVFGAGRFDPKSREGRHLLAHELAHVVQQKNDAVARAQLEISGPGDTDEIDAERVADRVDALESSNPAPGASMKPAPVERGAQTLRGREETGLVRVHTGPHAAQVARLIEARAFTVGRDLVFGAGEFAPENRAGRRLLAHELAHVAQDARGARPRVRRQNLPAGTSGQTSSSAMTGYRVEIITAEEYTAATGRDIQSLPDRMRVSPEDAGFGGTVNSPQWSIGLGTGAMRPAMPAFPLPQNATGFLWSSGHVSDFSIPEGEMVFRGFRAELWRHGASDLERGLLGRFLFGGSGGWLATRSLNRGVTGSWANDWMFPYFSDAIAVFPDRNLTPDQAESFAEFLRSRGPEFAEKTYRYSPPPRGSRAWVNAFGETPPDFVPPEVLNCMNRPVDIHEQAIGGETTFGPGRPGERSGFASEMGPWLDEPHPGVRTVRIGPAMRARVAVGAIRAGGVILLLYNASETYERITTASPEEQPIVIGEETGSWIGGWVGSVLTEALGGAFVCAETGPGAILCALAFGVVGGMGGSVLGHGVGHDIAKGLELLGDTPRLIEATTLMFGSEEDQRNYYELREIETGEPSPFSLF
jgi:hypothetical protein